MYKISKPKPFCRWIITFNYVKTKPLLLISIFTELIENVYYVFTNHKPGYTQFFETIIVKKERYSPSNTRIITTFATRGRLL